jgi:hypothetical protein
MTLSPLHAAAFGLTNIEQTPAYRAALDRIYRVASVKLDAETVAHLRAHETDLTFDDLRDTSALLDDVVGSFMQNDPWLDLATVRVVCARRIAAAVATRR